MKHFAKLINSVEVKAGDRFRSTLPGRDREIVKLVSVAHEDGSYTMGHCRWILVSESLGASTWDSKFHATPQGALKSGKWEKV